LVAERLDVVCLPIYLAAVFERLLGKIQYFISCLSFQGGIALFFWPCPRIKSIATMCLIMVYLLIIKDGYGSTSK